MTMAFTVRVERGPHHHMVYPAYHYTVERAGDTITLVLAGEGGTLTRVELDQDASAFVMNASGTTVDVVRHKRVRQAELRRG